MTASNTPGFWQRWWRQPRRTLFRKILFQVHLYSGISLGLYIFFISITGSVLVYRNELYVMATPDPVISNLSGPVLSDATITRVVQQANPGVEITRLYRPGNPDQAVEIWLQQPDTLRKRLFDPHSGQDIGNAEQPWVTVVSMLIEIHEEFLAGATGKKVNGIAAIAVLGVACTGLLLWWPGISRWRRSLKVHRHVGWKRFNWELHNAVGVWTFAWVFLFALSGVYLCFPDSFHEFAEHLQPMTEENAGERLVDNVLYWLAFLHFGRINGIGLLCAGPGFCDQSVKAVWALFGLAPALMFVTGATMWWNRVLKRWLSK